MHAIKCLIPTLILLCILDYLWLGSIGKKFYVDSLSNILLMKEQAFSPRIIPALIVYLLMATMFWYIVLPLADYRVACSFLYGALAGFILYGVYDMTNLAILGDWTLSVAVIDWFWGCCLCSVSSGFCAYLYQICR